MVSATTATVLDLVSVGALDQFLYENATSTFWRSKYNKCTNFALEAASQNFSGTGNGGSGVQSCTLSRTGDLVYFMYYTFTLEGIQVVAGKEQNGDIKWRSQSNVLGTVEANSTTRSNVATGSGQNVNELQQNLDTETVPYAHYTNSVGQAAINYASIQIGGQEVDKIYGDYLYVWEELSGKSGKRMYEMTGNEFTRADLVQRSKRRQQYFVPLPFWFTQSSGNSLALTSLQFHTVQVNIDLKDSTELIVAAGDSDNYQVQTISGKVIDQSNIYSSGSADDSTGSDTVGGTRLLTTSVFLDVDERKRFSSRPFEQLIVQVKRQTTSTAQTDSLLTTLTFNNPVIELIWYCYATEKRSYNDWFDFSGVYGNEIVKSASLKVQNNDRCVNYSGKYYRTVQPFQHHSNIPDSYVYCYSFALYPEDVVNPSGSCNFSRINDKSIELTLTAGHTGVNDTTAATVELVVFARSWNILRYVEGMGGMAYSN